MKFFFSRKPAVLVIGSAHMDVLGDFSSSEKLKIDKEGEVFCSIGGTAFNIAVDIANEGGAKVALFTHVRGRSPITTIIFSRLKDEGISVKHVIRDPSLQKDSGFIAHRVEGELISAVSSMAIEDAIFSEKRLLSAIRGSMVVVADCNISGTQLALVAKLCQINDRPLIVAGVSESKCQKVKLLDSFAAANPPILYFSVNAKEANAIFGKMPSPSVKGDVISACHSAHARNVIVTDGENGWTVFSDNGFSRKFEAPHVPNVRSSSGAGDALVAAVAHYVAMGSQHDPVDLRKHIHRFVDNVLRKRVASGADLTSLETLGAAKITSRLREPFLRIGAALAGLVAVLGLIAGIIQAAVSLESSTKVAPRLFVWYCKILPSSSDCVPAKVVNNQTGEGQQKK